MCLRSFLRPTGRLLPKCVLASVVGTLLLLVGCSPAVDEAATPLSESVHAHGAPSPEMEAMPPPAPGETRLRVLFLGDNGGHRPAERAKQLIPVMLDRGIHITYTEDVARALTRETLDRYDALLLFANIDTITDPQAAALLSYVADGGGFVPIHSASYCFRNNAEVVALIGGQFMRHGDGVFRTRIAEPEHPIMQGMEPIESWDETYEHRLHNEENRIVLSYREEEPYTWVRTHGEGRVFYTAWGHDHRTWGHPGFQDLIERGIRWSAGQDVPLELAAREISRPFEYIEQRVVYYPPGQSSRGDGEWNQMQKPLSPEESMERIIVPGGFELQLFASEPDIRKPITMAFDERGRLWVAETIDYPNELRPAGQGRDRLTVLEDTTGDGKADTFTVFAENLSIPTGIAFARGGVIVYHAPDTLFLKDTTGDGKADLKEVLFTGWGSRDTHAQASNLRYGLDNWYWGAIGYSGFNGTVGGKEIRFSSGLHRFRGDGSELEFQRSTNNNTWGLGWSEDGLVFGSTANNVPSVLMPFPNRYYDTVGNLNPPVLPSLASTSRFLPIRDKIRQVDVHGGYTAAAGHALYTARTWPREYWNRISFVAGPTGHLLGEFVLTPAGAGFRAENATNLMVSDDEWSSPIMAEVGPDGHLWVIDWYNYIIQHNPTPAGHQTGAGNAYITDLRDKRHGRIYRVVYTGAEATEPFSLHGASLDKLVATLSHPNMLWRLHAQRLLVERGQTDVVPALLRVLAQQEVDEIGLNVGAIHALWTLHGLGSLNGSEAQVLAAVTAALEHPSPGVRRNAAAVLPRTNQTARALLAARLLEDDHAQVRLAALLALAEVPPSRAVGEAVYRVYDQPANRGDRIIEDALIIAIIPHQHGFLAAAQAEGRLGLPAEEEVDRPNLVTNPSLDQLIEGQAVGWSTRNYGGRADFQLVPEGRRGGHALRISSTAGADASFYTEVAVQPHTLYKLSGWVKTEEVAGAAGGLFNIHGLGRAEGATTGVRGTHDWQQIEKTFDSGHRTQVVINALFGGWGTSTGTAWFDDISLVEMGSAAAVDRVLEFVQQYVNGVDGDPAAAVPPGFADAEVIELGVIPDLMRYDKEELTVTAGQKVRLVFSNPDHMPHNLLFLEIGTLEKVGALADQMLADPQAAAKDYVPDSPDVWASTPVINPDETYELYFTAPTAPGRYPFVCTFPGHWRMMNGVMIVR